MLVETTYVTEFEYYFTCTRKDVHLYSVNKSWQNDICSFRATNVALTLSFKDHRQRIPRFVIRRYLEEEKNQHRRNFFAIYNHYK